MNRFRRVLAGLGALVLSLTATTAFAATQNSTVAAAAPTASQLLAKTATCSQVSNGKYATDEGGAATVAICKNGTAFIPDGGGWRTQGRAHGKLNRTATTGHATDKFGGARLGYAYLHTAIDDHSRPAYIVNASASANWNGMSSRV